MSLIDWLNFNKICKDNVLDYMKIQKLSILLSLDFVMHTMSC